MASSVARVQETRPFARVRGRPKSVARLPFGWPEMPGIARFIRRHLTGWRGCISHPAFNSAFPSDPYMTQSVSLVTVAQEVAYEGLLDS